MKYLKRFFLSLGLFLIFFNPGWSQHEHVFSLGKKDFLMDGKPFQIISGELHPARIPEQYWRHRIRMVKALGCNTVALYIFWNYHEPTPGNFDFSSGNKNISEFLKLCQEEDMYVLLRPGPYVCGEWDLGGIPPYLLSIPDIKLRCRDPRYMDAAENYIEHISDEVRPFLFTNGGPILMVQLENEYGSYGNDKEYLKDLRSLWEKNGIDTPFFSADGATPFMLEAGHLKNTVIGLDSGSNDKDFEEAYKADSNAPSFSSETYPGWLTHWGEDWAAPDTVPLLKSVKYLLENKKSFNFYVAHGGTNFGFSAGANAFSPTEYMPDVTSYDYDAPIDEQGRPTAKYYALRKLIGSYRKTALPEIPRPIPVIDIPEIQPEVYTSFWDNLPSPKESVQPKPMEAYGQYHGCVLYKTKLIGRKSGKLIITEPHDFALVYLNGKYIGTVERDGGNWSIEIPETDVKDPELEILVEGMGRINFGAFLIDRKGITDRVTLNGMTLMNWKVFNLPLDNDYISKLQRGSEMDKNPVFFKASFELDKTGDTFIDLSNYKKGIVWVNGHNLGRFWNKGPQERLYCPANFLKKKNEILILDFYQKEARTVSGATTLKEQG